MISCPLIKNPEKEDLPAVFELINNEFIFNKNRKIGLQVRFPYLFIETNLINLFGLYINKELCSFLSVKPMEIKFDKEKYNIFLVGFVCTKPEERGKGYSRKLMEYISEKYMSLSNSVGILWTTITSYYEKLGWYSSDNNIFIELSVSKEIEKNRFTGSSVIDIEYLDINCLENFRRKCQPFLPYQVNLKNTDLMNQVVPLPADYVRMMKLVYNQVDQGIIVYGLTGNKLYVYDFLFINNSAGLELLKGLLNNHLSKEIYINIPEMETQIDLIRSFDFCYDYFRINRQNHAMYFFNDLNLFKEVNKYYVPYIHRI